MGILKELFAESIDENGMHIDVALPTPVEDQMAEQGLTPDGKPQQRSGPPSGQPGGQSNSFPPSKNGGEPPQRSIGDQKPPESNSDQADPPVDKNPPADQQQGQPSENESDSQGGAVDESGQQSAGPVHPTGLTADKMKRLAAKNPELAAELSRRGSGDEFGQ